jgi:hypothetical protein
MAAKNCANNLIDSVLPDPLSPLFGGGRRWQKESQITDFQCNLSMNVPDDHRLIFVVLEHSRISFGSDRKQMTVKVTHGQESVRKCN